MIRSAAEIMQLEVELAETVMRADSGHPRDREAAIEAIEAHEYPTPEEQRSIDAGELLCAYCEARLVDMPKVPRWLRTLRGLTEVQRWVYAALLEHEGDVERPIARIMGRFRLPDHMRDEMRIAVAGVVRAGFARGDRDRIRVVRRRGAR